MRMLYTYMIAIFSGDLLQDGWYSPYQVCEEHVQYYLNGGYSEEDAKWQVHLI